MSRKVNHFEAQRVYIPDAYTTLSVIESALIPTMLSALETRKGRSFWAGYSSWSEAYQDLCKQQWELLMDAADRIVLEIRALRDGVQTDPAYRDPNVDPFTVQATSLNWMFGTMYSSEGVPFGQVLGQMLALQQAAAQGDTEALEQLTRIAAVIAGAQ